MVMVVEVVATAGDTMEADTEAWEATVTIPARVTTASAFSRASTWEDTAVRLRERILKLLLPFHVRLRLHRPQHELRSGYVDPAADGTYVDPVQNATAPATTVVQPTVPIAVSTGTQGAMLGIDEQAVVDALGQGMRVDRVYPGSPAERAGLQVGDVIHSANGYLTQIHGNLTWIINTQAPNGVLNLSVHRASDNRDATVVAQLP